MVIEIIKNGLQNKFLVKSKFINVMHEKLKYLKSQFLYELTTKSNNCKFVKF